MIAKYVYLNINNKKQSIMTTFEKLENWALHTKDIESLRNAFIEVIANNKVNLADVYNDHKKSIDKTNAKDLSQS